MMNDTGVYLAWLGWGVSFVIPRMVDSNQVFIVLAGIALSTLGCCLWARHKGRHWAWGLWGILTPIGFLGVALLKNRKVEAE